MNTPAAPAVPVHVLVVGSGKLAQELLTALPGPGIASAGPWQATAGPPAGPAVVVHAGSGRELEPAQDYCASHRLPLVELATAPRSGPWKPGFPVVVCPNTNVLMLRFMAMLRREGRHFGPYAKTLLESHQASKTSEPGTALNLAESLGIGPGTIESVRDPAVQESRLGIPGEHLGRHALHRIVIQDGPATVTLETRILGQAPYAEGLAQILRKISAGPLEPRVYDVLEFF